MLLHYGATSFSRLTDAPGSADMNHLPLIFQVLHHLWGMDAYVCKGMRHMFQLHACSGSVLMHFAADTARQHPVSQITRAKLKGVSL